MNEVRRLKPGLRRVKKIKLGEEFWISLTNAFGREICGEEDFEHVLNEKIGHPVVGPISVEGVKKGDTLEVFIKGIRLGKKAYQCVSFSTGVLKGEICNRNYKIYKIRDGVVVLDGVEMHVRPSVGYVSMQPSEEISCGRACRHGGNLDFNQLGVGSSVILPVEYDGGRLFVGDLHALQGNGEICGMAMECGGDVLLEVRKSPVRVKYPLIKNPEGTLVVGWGGTVEEASQKAVRNTIDYCVKQKKLDVDDSYLYLSANADLVFGNFTGNVKTCAVFLSV